MTLIEAMARAIKDADAEGNWSRKSALAALKAMKEHGVPDELMDRAVPPVPQWRSGPNGIRLREMGNKMRREDFNAILQAAINEAENAKAP